MQKFQLDLNQLNYNFKAKPLLVGGRAKEIYEIRPSGKDIDLIVSAEDYHELAKMYPENLKDLFGDLGVCVFEFEIWKTIASYDYEFLSQDALEFENYKLISIEKLAFMTAMAISKEKYRQDLELIVKKIYQIRYNRQA